MNYNLLDEKWIPVLYRDGKYERVGIRKALEEAGRIRQIAASNPMDNVALPRFLLAVLVWCKPKLAENESERLKGAKGIPGKWLTTNLGTGDKPNEVFNLLGDGQRFYQDKGILDDLLKTKQTETSSASLWRMNSSTPLRPCASWSPHSWTGKRIGMERCAKVLRARMSTRYLHTAHVSWTTTGRRAGWR